MSEKVPRIKLNDGNEIPIIGFGTYDVKGEAVLIAVEAGYRHFDGADYYGNEKEVGEALRQAISGGIVTRNELFITSKVWPNYHSKGRPTLSVKRTLKNLGFDYVNLLLIHWPTPFKQGEQYLPQDTDKQLLFDESIQLSDIWEEFIEIKKSGMARSIGVSNFNSAQLNEIIQNTSVVPAVNQVESHPYLNNHKLLKFCQQKGIALTGYSPLASTGPGQLEKGIQPLFELPLIKELAKKYNKSEAAVCLRWQTQRGVIPLPKSSTKKRIVSNLNIFGFELSSDEINAINGLDNKFRCFPFPFLDISSHKNYPFNADF